MTARGDAQGRDNIRRLVAARQSCEAQFALVQDGLDWPEGLEFGRTRGLADLDGLCIGIGPEGSGTRRLARTI